MAGPKSKSHGKSAAESSRARRAAEAQETLRIMQDGGYADAEGSWVDLSGALATMTEGTEYVSSASKLHRHPPARRFDATIVDHEDDCTLAAAERLARSGLSVCALNFASAKHPGGGFLRGAEAQEEHVTRRSALYASLTSPAAADHYEDQRAAIAARDGVYGHSMLYTPACPVFRAADGSLRPDPFAVAFVSSPAPNAGVARERGWSDAGLAEVLEERADRVMAVAAAAGHDGLVLGAWGCGVFGNDPAAVARVFTRLVRGKYSGVFHTVSFPLRDDANRRPFEDALSSSKS